MSDGMFWDKVDKTATCWLWTRCKDSAGYGLHSIGGRSWKAHRVSWIMHFGEIPKGMFVCHTCDVRTCVNPAHLFLRTHADNMADMAAKGRTYFPLGGKPGAAVLTVDQVLEIRALGTSVSQRKIAKIYDITQANVSSIVTRKTWKHI